LKGLDIEGGGHFGTGISFGGGAALHVHKVQIRNFRSTTAVSNAGGIFFSPNAYAELYVVDSYITDNGGPSNFSGGILISPISTGSVNAFINRAQIENNSVGINVRTPNSTGVAVNAVIRDSVVAGSGGDGISAISPAGKASVSILVDGVKVATNFGSGIRADGAATSGAGSAIVRISNSTIANNVTGVSTANVGQLESFKNNVISGNLTDGTPIPAFPGPGGTPLQ
jgi:hypothetical protein